MSSHANISFRSDSLTSLHAAPSTASSKPTSGGGSDTATEPDLASTLGYTLVAPVGADEAAEGKGALASMGVEAKSSNSTILKLAGRSEVIL